MGGDNFEELIGTVRLEADGESDPIKDILDYNLETTSEIFVHFPDGREVRFIREDKSVKSRLDLIERKVREVFDGGSIKTDTNYELYHRAQVLADIFAIFEYDGATIGKEEKQ